jgi:hypothetical protein
MWFETPALQRRDHFLVNAAFQGLQDASFCHASLLIDRDLHNHVTLYSLRQLPGIDFGIRKDYRKRRARFGSRARSLKK